MPLNNRYVVAAFDSQKEHIAFLSPSIEWMTSVREAVCFPSQQEANRFILQQNLHDNGVLNSKELENFHHLQSVFVTVADNDVSTSEHVTDDVISFTGIYG